MSDLKDKLLLITGAGSGIGQALAIHLDNMGAKLILNDVNEAALQDVAESLNQSPLCISFSVAIKSEWLLCKSIIDEHFAGENYTGIDGIINNAGIAHDPINFEMMTDQDYKTVMDVNFYGVLFGSQTFLPELKAKNESWLVNISSIFGITSIGQGNAYCASKFAVKGLTESLRMEAFASFPQVNVCTVHPGGIKTPIADNAISVDDRSSQQRTQDTTNFNKQLKTSPQKAAEVIVNGMLHKKHRILIGPDARIMDYLARLFPVAYTKILLKFLNKKGLIND
jgi:NADP-dependent 3-hydroxy acid dehydrogenase YdfG